MLIGLSILPYEPLEACLELLIRIGDAIKVVFVQIYGWDGCQEAMLEALVHCSIILIEHVVVTAFY